MPLKERRGADDPFQLTYERSVGHLGSLADCRSLPQHPFPGLPDEEQVVKHNCIQGWSAVAKWTGVPLATAVGPCPRRGTSSFMPSTTQPRDGSGYFYETLNMKLGFRMVN